MTEEAMKINNGVLEKIDCSPKDSVWSLSARQRALGRIVDMQILKREDYNELAKDSKENKLNETLLNAESARDLAKDCFWALFQNEPQHLEPVSPYRQISDKIMRWVEKSALWEKNRINSVNSLGLSSISGGLLFSLLMNDDTLREALDEQEKLNQQMQEAQKQLSQDGESQDGQSNSQGQDNGQNEKAAQQMADALSRLEELSQEIDDHLDTAQAEAIRANAIDEAGKESEKASAMMSGFGLNGSFSKGTDMQNLMALYDQLKDKRDIRRMIDCIGRARGIAMDEFVSKKKAGETETLVDSDYTRDIINIFPSERFLLRKDVHPALRAQKMCEYADRGLLGMIHGEHLENHGSLIIGVDISTSMSTMLGGVGLTKVDFARALALGIVQAAKDNGQNIQIFLFNTSPIPEPVLNEKATVPDLYDFLDIPCKGGTQIANAIIYACEQTLGMGSKTENTDIVLITDAEDRFNPDIQQLIDMKATWGTRLITLGIGVANSYQDLAKISDAFIEINSTDDFDDIAKRLANELR